MLLLLSSILLLLVARPSDQVTYSCDSGAVCGCSTYSAIVTKIVGGEAASPETWGWAVSLLINNQYLCGGSIISSSWILTAAHCAIIASQITIYAGSNLKLQGSQIRTAAAIIWNPNYNGDTYVNDIALLRLSAPLNMDDPAVAAICLPAFTTAVYPPVGSLLVAVGWGTLSENGRASSTLQQVTVQAVSYGSTGCSSPYVANTALQFCAGVVNGGKDTCQGDSGGPLMLFTSNTWFVAGITSYGDGCARPNVSGIYTRVAAYVNWIYSTMNNATTITTTTLSSTPSIGLVKNPTIEPTVTNITNFSPYHRSAPIMSLLTWIVLSLCFV